MTTYGIEIECASPVDRYMVRDALRGAGIRDAIVAPYSGRDYSVWQVKFDTTIPTRRGLSHQIEVVSPVLTWGNDDHLAQVRIVSETLTALGCRVLRPVGSYSCGFHTHVSMADLSPGALASWFRSWHARQDTTDSLVRSGRERGGSHSNWCAVLTASMIDRCATAAGNGDARALARSASGHNLAINTQWFHERGTIEVRQRDGAIDWRKQIGWVAYVMATKSHADAQTVYTGSGDGYLAWLVDSGFMSEDHRQWAERNVSVMSAADMVTEQARSMFGGLRQTQGI